MAAIGRSLPRKEGRRKVTGQARYIDDLTLPGMLHGTTVRSASPRGAIRSIDFEPGVPWDEFTIVTADDIPGANVVALITSDQPYLAAQTINHPEEPVVLLGHPDRHLLEKARQLVRIVVDRLPPVFSIDESLARTATIWGSDNIFKSYLVSRGDVNKAFAEAAHIVEGTYETGAQEQLYIEPNGMLAVADPESGVSVWGSMQCPYYVHRALAGLFALPSERVRVVQMETGGGFGGKEEYPSILAGHAALLAWKARRPVKMIYDRLEDMVATTKRHPSRTRHRTAIDREGRLLAMDIEFLIDGGAYCTLSPVVLSRGTIHAAGPYFCPNVRIRSKAVATNAPPHGAFRGFGAPQSVFALELQMDKVAAAAGLTSEEFRQRNFISTGQANAVGQVLREPVDMPRLLDRAFQLSDYHAKSRRFSHDNMAGSIRRGMGFACFMHGAGFTGSGEEHLASLVTVEAAPDGHIRVLAASTEIGQGTNTVFAQIASDALGIDGDEIEIVQPDTAAVPNSGPTVASRTSMVVGKLVETAALGVRSALMASGLLADGYESAAFRSAAAAYVAVNGSLRSTAQYHPPGGLHWDDEKYEGDAYGAYAWAVYVAEVAVDLTTFEARVEDFVAVQEVGRVINPILAAGQIEGGVAQAIGWALYEDVVWHEGRMVNGQMTNYIMPTSVDLPDIRVEFVEFPYPHGPGGAKGIGELPMDGPAPAIFNAVRNATGLEVTTLPLTPERLLEAFRLKAEATPGA